MGTVSIVTGVYKDSDIEAWAFLSMPFMWVMGAIFLGGFIICLICGFMWGMADRDDRPLLQRVIEKVSGNSASNAPSHPKLKDPSHYMKGKK
jgi:hypothetical protein